MTKVFTSDHFETYKKCPKAYLYKYEKNIRFAIKKDTYMLGRDIHSLVYYKLKGHSLDKVEHALDEDTRKHWQNIAFHPLLKKKLICAEWGFDILLKDDIWLNGRIDAVFEDDGNYIIADWKTGENLPYAPENKFQAMIYMYAFFMSQKDLGLNFEASQLKFIFIGSAEKNLEKEIICNYEMIKDIEKNLLSMSREMLANTDFEANKKSCKFCDFQKICDA